LAGAELVRRPSQRLVKTGTVCVVKVVALVCWDKVDFRPVRQVDGLVEEKSSAPHPRLEGQRHGVSLGSLRASRNLSRCSRLELFGVAMAEASGSQSGARAKPTPRRPFHRPRRPRPEKSQRGAARSYPPRCLTESCFWCKLKRLRNLPHEPSRRQHRGRVGATPPERHSAVRQLHRHGERRASLTGTLTVNDAPRQVTATIGSDGSVSGTLLNPDGSKYGVFWGRPNGRSGMSGSFDLNGQVGDWSVPIKVPVPVATTQ